jgi:hypothetical protein
MGNEETDVGMSCGTYGKYISAFKIDSKMFKLYTKIELKFIFEL